MQCYKLTPIVQNGIRYWVPCGKCNFCLQNKRIDWAIRMMEEEKVSKTAYFLTLTYDQEHIPLITEEVEEGYYQVTPTLRYDHLKNFNQSLKRKQKRFLKKQYSEWKYRYFAVQEYGSITGRPHYHVAGFNIHPKILDAIVNGNEVWGKGRIHVGSVTEGSAAYVAKYMIDRTQWETEGKPNTWEKTKTVMSRNPGLGESYIGKNLEWHRGKDIFNPEDFRIYMQNGNRKRRLPRYYKDKIFKNFDEETQKLMDTALEIHNWDLGEKFEKAYLQEIERLSRLHPNPEEYYQERIKHQHDQIRIKSLQSCKL